MGRIVLVTGVSGAVGERFARRIAADPAVERVVGVDAALPQADLGPVGFVRADIRTPVIAEVITDQDVDTVVHLSVQSSGSGSSGSGSSRVGGSRASVKEHNVIGTMQLLGACQRAPGLERLVVKSSSAVYGSSSRDPAMFTEDMSAKRQPKSGYAKDIIEVEGYVRGFARRRPEVAVTVLRAANVIGPTVSTPLTSYFRLPVVPTVLGYDARLQLVHEDDLLDALRHATLDGASGTFNLAGDGVLMLSQALRRLGRPTVAVPGPLLSAASTVTRPAAVRRIESELLGFLKYGRGLDTSHLHARLGFTPSYTTADAFADFARTVAPATLTRRTALSELPMAAGTGDDGG